MGTRRGSPMNVLFGWLRKKSMKVKIFLGTLVAVCALVALKFTVKNYFHFFIASEAIHLAGIIVLIYKLLAQKTCSGLSLKSQELTALFFATRLCYGILSEVNTRTMLDLISLLSTLLITWLIRFKLRSSYIKELDNFRLSIVLVPSAILAILIHPYTKQFHLAAVLWAFTVYLEAVSVLPLRYMQNAKMVETFTGYYVFALGVSRFLALSFWIIQYSLIVSLGVNLVQLVLSTVSHNNCITLIYETPRVYVILVSNGYYWFLAASFSELVQSFILADFCYYYMKSFIQGQLLRKMPI